MTDYYKLLGVTKESNQSEIKKAYRKLAVKHHPDKGGDPEIFKQVAEAYEILSDPIKKQHYDMLGVTDVNLSMDPMNMFKEFERMFTGNIFQGQVIDPTNLTTHQFSGFNNSNDPLQSLFMNINTNPNINSYSQTTTIINGHRKIIINDNGTITEITDKLNSDSYLK